MRTCFLFVLSAFLTLPSLGHASPIQTGEVASVRLLSVEGLVAEGADRAPDGLSFHFLVSRTALGRHELGMQETRDLQVRGASYQQATEAALGRVFEPSTKILDPARFAAAHPALAEAVIAAPQRSLVVAVAIGGAPLVDGDEVEVKLRVGFGRSPGAPQVEDFVFKTAVPRRAKKTPAGGDPGP